MKFKGFLLDIDNTLYDYEKTHQKALEDVFAFFQDTHGLNREKAGFFYKTARSQIQMELRETAASHHRLLYFQRMFELLKMNPLKNSLDAYDSYWNSFLDNLEARDGVYDFLEKIKPQKVCFVTDLTAHIQHRKIRRLKLFDYADFLVTSEEAGHEKPHPYIFLLALSKMGLGKEDVCMIGDSLSLDIAGAVNLGIRSFWLNPSGKKEPLGDLAVEFRNFSELDRWI